jgi:hypothetical protein
VAARIKPSFSIFEEEAREVTVTGIVGTLDLGRGRFAEIVPKTQPDGMWIEAVLDLLVGSDAVDVAGYRIAGRSSNRRNLFDVLAGIYAARLSRAIGRDGPIQVMEQNSAELPLLNGKLQVSRWVRNAAWSPHRLPVAYNHLTPNNDFSRALAWVALHLARSTGSITTRRMLLNSASALQAQVVAGQRVAAGIAYRRLPPQWAIYDPAWSIATAVLTNRFLLGSAGSQHGIAVTVEAWPLLERLLERTLATASRLANRDGDPVVYGRKAEFPILNWHSGTRGKSRSVVPDGRLLRHGVTIATFEAKYIAHMSAKEWPGRSDMFQALSTAAACGSPLAVMVYPTQVDPCWWDVRGFGGSPKWLVALGLDLFGYRIATGGETRAEAIRALLSGPAMAQPQTLELAEESAA